MSRDYTDFDSSLYSATFHGGVQAPNAQSQYEKFRLKAIHEFLKSGGLVPNSVRVLEMGGGPDVVNCVTLVHYARELVFGDYSEANRSAVQDWVYGLPDAPDLTDYFRYVVVELEGHSGRDVETRQAEVRSKIKIVPCDMNDPSPMLGLVSGDFDVINTHLMLEVASQTKEAFVGNLTKLKGLLKATGGKLVMGTALQCTKYSVGETVYGVLSLTEDDVVDAVKAAGFNVLKSDKMSREDMMKDADPEEIEEFKNLTDGQGHLFIFAET